MSNYDGAITVFSPDGRLYQVTYATKAVEKGQSCVAIATDDAIVFAVSRRQAVRLRDESATRKIFMVDDNVCFAFSGLTADARVLLAEARRESVNYRLRYGEPAPPSVIAHHIALTQQRYTQSGGVRPFGVSCLICGFEDGKGVLFKTDPNGVFLKWKATAVGRESNSIIEHLETLVGDQELNAEIARGLAQRAILESAESTGVVDVFQMSKNGVCEIVV